MAAVLASFRLGVSLKLRVRGPYTLTPQVGYTSSAFGLVEAGWTSPSTYRHLGHPELTSPPLVRPSGGARAHSPVEHRGHRPGGTVQWCEGFHGHLPIPGLLPLLVSISCSHTHGI